ncbi:endonuclease domain-containing protein [Streptomyces mayteni]
MTGPRGRGLDGHQGLEVRWTVRLDDDEVVPASVPLQQRCPVNVHLGRWPRYLRAKSKLGRIRAQLAVAFGPLCAGCGTSLGTEVEHHHFSGRVRGLLCRNCNNAIDWCPHLANCPWADCLNDLPPPRCPAPGPIAGLPQRPVEDRPLRACPLRHLSASSGAAISERDEDRGPLARRG